MSKLNCSYVNPLFIVVLLLICHIDSFAGSPALRFAIKYNGQYTSEIKDTVDFSQTFITRINMQPSFFKSTFVDSSKEISIQIDEYDAIAINNPALDTTIMLGVSNGTTALGVKMQFKKQKCYRIFLKGDEDILLGGKYDSLLHKVINPGKLVFFGSPKQFRDLTKEGIDIKFTFTPLRANGLLVEYTHTINEASLDKPFETDMNVYTFPARIHKIEYFIHNDNKPFRIDDIEGNDIPTPSSSIQALMKTEGGEPATIFFASVPPLADVYLDGKYIGSTNKELNVLSGTHSMLFAKGDKSIKVQMTFTPGENKSRMVNIESPQ